MIAVPAALRICSACGDLASGDSCDRCDRMADEYDERYHAYRAAQLFGSLPRENAGVEMCESGGLLRGLISALRIYAFLAAALLLLRFVARPALWHW